jgi:transcriptional regulator with XRE-family HTH domain
VKYLKKYERIANLRIDNDITQYELALYLNITQRSYSRYETGTSNIPLEMLSMIADYYNVSTDYLLGRTNEKLGGTKEINVEDAPQTNDKSLKGSIHINLGKKMIQNSIALIYDLLGNTNNKTLASELTNYFSFPIYKIVRYIYDAKNNTPGFFTLPHPCFPSAVDSQAILCEMRLKNTILNETWPSSNHSTVDPELIPKIDHQMLSATYPAQFTSLLNILHSIDSKCLPSKKNNK